MFNMEMKNLEGLMQQRNLPGQKEKQLPLHLQFSTFCHQKIMSWKISLTNKRQDYFITLLTLSIGNSFD